MSKLQYFIISLILILPLPLYSAGPITHVVLGEQWLKLAAPDYTDQQKKEFLLGTVFPDIRYLGVIKREKTHFKGVTLQVIRNTESPFKQGMLFHSYVDEFRKKWVREKGIEKKLIDISTNQQHTFLKIIEDQILYSEYSWAAFRQYLMTIPDDERKFGITDKALNEWHTGLTLYFTASPEVLLMQIGLLDKDILTIKAPVVKQWGRLLSDYVASAEMQKHVRDMMGAFEKSIALSIKKQG
jgi:hypothetical protein